MRTSLIIAFGVLTAISQADAEEPLVAQYLYSGRLARGEQAMDLAVATHPADDQLRFGLAVLQLTRSFERLGQSLYQYGCVTTDGLGPILHLPVPTNPDPSPISYADLCRILDLFHSDLVKVESTLAEIKADDVRLRLRMAEIRLNLTGLENAQERYRELLQKALGTRFQLPQDNPDLEVCFDRGDVFALRAHCHLLMGFIDILRACDSEEGFSLWVEEQFAKPKNPSKLSPAERRKRQDELWKVIKIGEPARLGHFRRHMVKFCELSRESWTAIRRETDDDHEWLPNPRQTGVLRVPVTDEFINDWLAMLAETESLYEGKKSIPPSLVQFISPLTSRRMNLKTWLDNPPDSIEWERLQTNGIREQYLDDSLKDIDIMALLKGANSFHNILTIGYGAWFN